MSGLWEVAAACGGCGSEDWTVEREICARRFGRCAGCGVIRLIDRVAEARLDLLYTDYYPATIPTDAELERDLANPSFAFRRRRLEAAIGRRERRLHEIGCGDGNFLAALKRDGWAVSGAEFGATARATARRHGLDVREFDDHAGVSTNVPVIAAYHVLEHIYHPAAWLRAAAARLAPDGLLHLQVPNYASLSRALTGEQWASWHFPQHVFLYTPRTLADLLQRTGFRMLSLTTWDPWHGPGTVSSSLRNAVRHAVRGGSPWTAELGGARSHAALPRAAATRRAIAGALAVTSYALARGEAAVGRGAVIDVVAARNFSSPPAENFPPASASR